MLVLVSKNKDSPRIYIIDTSAILSGKPLPVDQQDFWTVEEVAEEFSPGGSSYRMFQYLREKGLSLHRPSKNAKRKVNQIIQKLGENLRLSSADRAVLSLAVDVDLMENVHAVILTDDYSIQNIASVLKIEFQPISQKGITKTLKWIRRCQGCKRVLSSDESVCPICGSNAQFVVDKKEGKNQDK